ncbi:MAG: hypothetical protein ACXWC7_05600, partial [Chitinophagaceae bacterium]
KFAEAHNCLNFSAILMPLSIVNFKIDLSNDLPAIFRLIFVISALFLKVYYLASSWCCNTSALS